jgi:hypothetical protein
MAIQEYPESSGRMYLVTGSNSFTMNYAMMKK